MFGFPGSLILRSYRLPTFVHVTLSYMVGMAIWGWLEFILGTLGLRFLLYGYVGISFVVWLWQNYGNDWRSYISPVTRPDVLLYIVVAIGVCIQITSLWSYGSVNSGGVFFCCGNTSDNMYYAALSQELVYRYPPFEPGMYGTVVKNYHYWSNAVVAGLVRITQLPLLDVQFKYIPLLLSVMLGMTAISFAKLAALPKTYTRWLVFLLYFGSYLIYLIVSILRRDLTFHMSGLEDGGNFLVNLPRAFSIPVFFTYIALFVLYQHDWTKTSGKLGKQLNLGTIVKELHWTRALVLWLVGSSLIGFKVYTGFFILFGLTALALWAVYKRNIAQVVFFIGSVTAALIVYLPVNSGAGGLYFTGFALLENFIVQPWMMLDRLELARLIYAEHHNWPRVMGYYTLYLALYCVGIFGIKTFGIVQTKATIRLFPKAFHILVVTGLVVSLILGLFFQQTSGGANTFNFLVSVFIIGSIYAAVALGFWLNRLPTFLGYVVALIIVLVSLPRILYAWNANLAQIRESRGFVVSHDEVEALTFLRTAQASKEQVFIYEKNKEEDGLSLYAYVLTGRPMAFTGRGILRSHGVDISKKEQQITRVITSVTPEDFLEATQVNNIGFIYLRYPETIPILHEYLELAPLVYENKTVQIHAVANK